MTTAQALAAHASIYRAWVYGQATQADLTASELRCRACGASDRAIRATVDAAKSELVQRKERR